MKTLTRQQSREIAALRRKNDASIDLSDIPERTDWTNAVVGKFYRPIKKPVTLRLDADLLAWLKAGGPGYQTKINSLLREAMANAARRAPKASSR